MSILVDQELATAPTFLVTYKEIARFKLSFASREISISPLGHDISENTIRHLLVDQIWPRILAHDGQLVLHAAGVSTPNGAILFVGQSGRGKSTLAASLHQRGYALLGDDAMVVSPAYDNARCTAVYGSLRLFPDSIATLFDLPVPQSQVADYTSKQNVHLALPAGDDDQRVQAVFFLNPDENSETAIVEAVAPADGCMRMVEHSFWLDPTDLALTARKLTSASAVASVVPTYQLIYPRDYAKLAELHTAILEVLE